MDSNRNNVRRVVEDRLSSLPDELIHKILSCFDIKFAVQTCLLSLKWKLLWTSIPCLNFSTDHFRDLQKFAKFVKHVLSHRNHQIEVSSVKLQFRGAYNQVFVKNIANYAFSHNVQELSVVSLTSSKHFYPPSLFSSQSLTHFTLTFIYCRYLDIPQTALDFPALTTLNLSNVILSGDIFSKCVNLKNLTLKHFFVVCPEEVLDIITPRLSNLTLIQGNYVKSVNVIAPQLENLTIIRCSIDNLNAPPGISSFGYTRLRGYPVLQFCNDRFYSLNKVTLCFAKCYIYGLSEKEHAGKSINMLQKLQSARYLTLNADIVEYFSSYSDLLSQHSSSFSNLICLTIDYSMRKNTYKVTMPNQFMKFLLDNSPTATFIIKLPGSK